MSYNSENFDHNISDIFVESIYINYIQHIYYESIPEWYSIYVGPTINYNSKLGVGALIGTSLRMSSRFNLDFRYELSTETNQFQLGLIFTFNKKKQIVSIQ